MDDSHKPEQPDPTEESHKPHHREDDGKDFGIDLWFPLGRFKMHKDLAEPFTDEMSKSSKWLMYAISFFVLFLGICFGLRLLWTTS